MRPATAAGIRWLPLPAIRAQPLKCPLRSPKALGLGLGLVPAHQTKHKPRQAIDKPNALLCPIPYDNGQKRR